jgi:hypothetical protein
VEALGLYLLNVLVSRLGFGGACTETSQKLLSILPLPGDLWSWLYLDPVSSGEANMHG